MFTTIFDHHKSITVLCNVLNINPCSAVWLSWQSCKTSSLKNGRTSILPLCFKVPPSTKKGDTLPGGASWWSSIWAHENCSVGCYVLILAIKSLGHSCGSQDFDCMGICQKLGGCKMLAVTGAWGFCESSGLHESASGIKFFEPGTYWI